MITKVVYVLVSSENDYYTEQFFISSYSVKSYNPDSTVILLVDDRTEKYLRKECSNALRFVNDVVSVKFPEDFDNKKRSRYLKTSVREHISGDYLFIDTDTVICDKLDDIDEVKSDIAAVYDMHTPLASHVSYNGICFNSKLLGHEVKACDEYYNSGVMYVKDNERTRDFYKEWQNNYIAATKVGVTTDQQALLETNSKYQLIKSLGGIWNCQIINNVEYLSRAKVIHYYCTGVKKGNTKPPYLLMSNAVCEEIRKKQYAVDEQLEGYVVNAKMLFTTPLMIMSGEDLKLVKSLQFYLLKEFFYNHSKAFYRMEKEIAYFRKKFRNIYHKLRGK